jgi:hypothetical protein
MFSSLMMKSLGFSSNHGVANSWCRAANHEIFDFKSFIVTGDSPAPVA